MAAGARQIRFREAEERGVREARPSLPDGVIAHLPNRADPSHPAAPARRRRWPLVLGLVLFAVAGCVGLALVRPGLMLSAFERVGLQDSVPARGFAAFASLDRAPQAAPAVPPARLPVVALGRLEPESELIEVGAPSGFGEFRLEQLLVAEGDRVEAGARLAVLDNEERLRAALAQARADAAQREAALARTRRIVEAERAQRAAAVSRARAEVETSRTELGRAETLQAKGFTTVATLDQRTLSFRQASERLAEAQAAETRYAGALEDQPDLVLARQERAAAEAAVARAEAEHAQSFIAAPIAGRILKTHYRPGERIGSKGLLDMGATDRMMVKTEIYESDVGRLATGQEAAITATPLGDALSGHVERIGLQVQRQSVVDALPAANTDARVVEAWIRLDPESSKRASALTGLQVRVRVEP